MKKLFLCVVSILALTACGPNLEDAQKLGFETVEQMKKLQADGYKTISDFNMAEVKRLGFDNVDEMKRIQSLGIKSKNEYVEAEARASKLGFISVDEMTQLQSKGFESKKDYEDKIFEEELKNGSFLDFALGKKWSIGKFPCDLNGGAYSIYDKDKGYRFIAGGKEAENKAQSTVEYKDMGGKFFKLTQTFYSNDFVERMLRERNVVSVKLEWTFERLSKDTMIIHKKNTDLNFDLLIKGIKSYEIKTEDSSVDQLCPNQ